MKIKCIVSLVLGTMLFFAGCDSFDLDMTNDPNRLSIENANPRALLNGLYPPYVDFVERVGEVGARATRILPMVGSPQENGVYAEIFNNVKVSGLLSANDLQFAWNSFYSESIPEMDLIAEVVNTSDNALFDIHLAIVNILKAHMASVLVDYHGDIIFSEANRILEYPQPRVDDQEEVYSQCFSLLDEAIGILKQNPSAANLDDRFYNGNTNKWLKVANTLKLRMYKNLGDKTAFDQIISEGIFIENSDDDFQSRFFSQEINSVFVDDYGVGRIAYKSNWLMRKMLDRNDPRIRYYFYRQTGDDISDADILSCLNEMVPDHYSGFDYCTVEQGYIGRSHGSTALNDASEETDLNVATLYGVYPHGGRFDDDRFEPVTDLETGGRGEGIVPIILSSDVDFWRGQMTDDLALKANYLRAGIQKSIDKVMGMGSIDPNADLSFAPTNSEVEEFINTVINDYTSASVEDQKNIFAEQYWISIFGNSIEAYNFYRKTGYPNTLSPSWNAAPGAFPRSFLYPNSEVSTNPSVSNLDKKLTDQVFWDTNPAYPVFPIAN